MWKPINLIERSYAVIDFDARFWHVQLPLGIFDLNECLYILPLLFHLQRVKYWIGKDNGWI